jgi:hypothetical protein
MAAGAAAQSVMNLSVAGVRQVPLSRPRDHSRCRGYATMLLSRRSATMPRTVRPPVRADHRSIEVRVRPYQPHQLPPEQPVGVPPHHCLDFLVAREKSLSFHLDLRSE